MIARLLSALFLASCALEAAEVRVSIHHTFGGEPLVLDSLRYPGGAGETLSLSRVSYLLSGFALQRADGSWCELPEAVAWVDPERRRTGFVLGGVEPGRYQAVRFAVGLEAAANHASPERFAAEHPLNPNLNGLHWSWQGGYVFLALEGHFRTPGGEPEGFVYHLAGDAQRRLLTLPVALTVDRTGDLALQLDLAALLGGALAPSRDGTATHSRAGDPVSAALVAALPAAFHALAPTPAPAAPAPAPVTDLHLPARYTPYRFTVPRGFPLPALPRDNPLLEERVELGRRLFFDPIVSRDRTISCATCHRAENAFAEPTQVSRGVEGRTGTRNAMPLFNLAWKSVFFWDGRAASLREQALIPVQEHREMDLPLPELTRRLTETEEYRGAFARAFDTDVISPERVGLVLEQFLLTLVAGNSKFDRALRGAGDLSSAEQRGFELFMTEYDPRTGQYGADCFHCHGGPLFSDHQFHNNGLTVAGRDYGREGVTHAEADRAKFATPSLRNVARTGPYMHDGRFATLEEVVAHYSGPMERSASLDPNLAKHPPAGLQLTPADQAALVAFLRALTDEEAPR